jgi:hypothetical protein
LATAFGGSTGHQINPVNISSGFERAEDSAQSKLAF